VDLRPEHVTAWAGSYTLVQSAPESTVILTDLAGANPIYLTNTDFGVAWGSSARALAPLVGQEWDLGWLAAALMASNAPVFTGRSPFQDVHLAPAGCRIVLGSDGRPPVWTRAWQPTQLTVDQAAVQLREALAAGVTLRVGSTRRASSDCSGGLDSSTLCALAEQASTEMPLAAVTMHPAGVRRGGDMDYVHSLLAAHPGLDHHWLPLSGEHLPFSDIAGVPATDEPAPTGAGFARFAAQYKLLAQLGTQVHFTGDGGDTLLSGPMLYLADLVRDRQWRRFVGDAIGWARIRRTSPKPLIASALAAARTDHTQALHQLAAAVQHEDSIVGLRMPIPAVSWYLAPIPAWATQFARESAAEMVASAAEQPALAGLDYANQRILSAVHSVGRTAHADAQLAATFGVQLANPFLDSRVVDAVLSVHAWEHTSPAAYKPLLTKAVGHLLPPDIAGRTTKGTYQSDHYLGLRANLATLTDLCEGTLSSLGLVDSCRLLQHLDLSAKGLPVEVSAVEPAVAMEAWLRVVAAAPATKWQPAPALEVAA
jgi:asparagine synthase (glutamine-hydrolysing)